MCSGSRVRFVVLCCAIVLPRCGQAAEGATPATTSAPATAVECLADLLERYPDSKSAGNVPEGYPSASEVLEAMRALDDAQLRSALNTQHRARLGEAIRYGQGERMELFFTELIRRGGNDWRDYLVRCWQAEQQAHAELTKQKEYSSPLRNVEWLTAIRRLEGKPDPLRILAAGKRTRSCNLGYLPKFLVLLTNLDSDKQEVVFTEGGNYRSGRQTRWRFEVTDAAGNLLPCRPPAVHLVFGGMYTIGTLRYGESWATHLDMNKFAVVTSLGEYTVRIRYHDNMTIASREDVTGLITSTSLPIKVVVEPITVQITKREIAAMEAAIAQLPTKGRVKLLGGTYCDQVHDFIKSDSPAGRLLQMGWKAVPGLIDAALDEELNPTRRAWVLGLLASLTNHNNPRDEAGVLGPYRFRDSGWSIWGGAPGAMSGGLGVGMDSVDSRPIDVRKQRAFAKRWAVWKEKQYVRVETSEN